ncbi:hypothetical protein MOE50_04950 [Bacillus inaquosorum]|uniref:hypothetical protein n=1 Tax=Bacillus inaquosorum TaxID=483913 RepID=UPI00227EF348|nr:hypothetical protein [Bacillus inaquosorum]MCY9008349.1 hypothetical protein [Bacillus inaquosorum]MCY9038587.1 hypothetical protein [Bacillus inaquosorum]MCY9043835.1 hypothetical protein [Bacillus inaquosorum]
MDKYEQYTQGILGAISDVFNEESDHFITELEDVDLTEFFTAANMALLLLFNEFTGDQKNALEFTHVLNGLAAQKAIETVREAE